MKKDVVIYFISKVVIGLIGLLILKLYSSMVDPSGYGEYSLISSLVSAIISVFIGWIGSSSLRYYDEYKNNRGNFYNNITLYFIIMIVVSFVVLYIISFLMPSIPISKYYIYVIFFTITLALQEILEKLLRASNKTITYAISSILQSVLTILVFYALRKIYSIEVESIFISSIVSKAIFVIIALLAIGYVLNIKRIKLDKQILNKFLSYGIPMIGVWGVGWILHYCDRYIISMFINNYEVGIYDMSCKISENTINLIISSFTLSIFPMLIRDWNNGGVEIIEEKLKKLIKYYNILVLPAIVGLSLVCDKLYLGIIDPQYSSGKLVIIIICIGAFINGLNSILNKIWQLNEKTKNILYILIISVVANILLNIILIPKYGINAAALTTLVSYLLSIIITYVFVRKEMRVVIDIKSLIKTFVSCFVMGLFLVLFNNFVNNIFMLMIEVAIAIIIYAITNILLKNIDADIIDSFKGRLTKNGN